MSRDRGNASTLLRAAAAVSLGTAASRMLGFVREILMAVFFGTSLAKSAFDVAFRIPNLFRQLFGEGALASAFIPVFAESLEKEGLVEANRLVGRVMTMLASALLLIVTGGILLCVVAMHNFTLGVKAAAVLPLLGIMLPYVFFICLVAMCMGVLNALHHFTLPALTPVLLNLVWIGAVLFLCPRFGASVDERIYGVAWGILLAGFLQLAVQAPALRRFGIRPRLDFKWTDPRVLAVLSLMGPAALGMGVHQINVMIDGLLALAVGEWAPAALTYAERLVYLPLGVFATALGTVLLPAFSRQAARDRPDEIRRTLGIALRNLMLVMCPAAVGLMVFAAPVVRLVFVWKGGQFDLQSTTVTARALFFYAPGLVVFSLYKLLVPAFYAMKDTRTPVRVGVVMVGANLLMNITFILTWPRGYKHAGLACATVLASALNCLALGRILHARLGDPGWSRLLGVGLRALLASALMSAAAVLTRQTLGGWLCGCPGPPGKVPELAALLGGILIGLVVYAAAVSLLCRRELRDMRSSRQRAMKD